MLERTLPRLIVIMDKLRDFERSTSRRTHRQTLCDGARAHRVGCSLVYCLFKSLFVFWYRSCLGFFGHVCDDCRTDQAPYLVVCTSMMHLALFLLYSVGCGQQHWIHNHAIEQMNCASVSVDVDRWDAFAQFLDSPMDPRPKMIQLASELQDILMPYDVADPVIALQCPLGVSAAFHQLAILCLLVSADCAQRALRLLHLSKLFAFFSYNDFGLWFGDARWGTNLNMVSSDARALVEHRVFSPVQSEDRWRIGLVSYCNYDDNVTRLTHLSRSNKQAYASLHSHELFHFEQPFVTQAHPWMNKLLAIERKLQDSFGRASEPRFVCHPWSSRPSKRYFGSRKLVSSHVLRFSCPNGTT